MSDARKYSYVGQRCSARIVQLKALDRVEIEKIITQELVKALGL